MGKHKIDAPEHMYSANGELERPFQSSGWLVPSEVEHNRRYIKWKANLRRTSPHEPGIVTAAWRPKYPEHTTSGGKGMLGDFLALEGAPVEEIATFVSKWGPLDIRRVLFQKGYSKIWVGSTTIFRNPGLAKLAEDYAVPPWSYVDKQETAIQGEEPVYAWRYWSRKFRCAMGVWDSLHNGKLRCKEFRMNWDDLTAGIRPRMHWEHFVGTITTVYDEAAFGMYFTQILEDWMDLAGISLSVRYSDLAAFMSFGAETLSRVMHFEIRTNNLFAGLVLQLIAAISGVSGYAICSLCSHIYTPTRQPRAGLRHYCLACKKRADVIKAQRYRARKRNEERKQKGKNKR